MQGVASGETLVSHGLTRYVGCAGILYLLSCLAEWGDMRAELEAARAVPLLLDLLGTTTDTTVQVCVLALMLLLPACMIQQTAHGRGAD